MAAVDTHRNGRSSSPSATNAHDEVSLVHQRSHVPPFRPGNIIRLEMTNFLTFSRTCFTPGPRMNLVIGPNGTGKSTIVSAVCIVFGGKPSILGKNPDLASFVKYGTEEANIFCRLYEPNNPRGHVEIQRQFDTQGNNHFFINGQRVKLKDIQSRIIRRYDIQLDNLSQFMPQEKIAEFTNYKPDELLKLVIKSLGGAKQEDEYLDLMTLDSNLANHRVKLNKNKAQLQKLIAEQENDKEEVEQFKQTQKLKDDLDLLRRLRPKIDDIHTTLQYKNLRKEYKLMEEDYEKLKIEFENSSTNEINAKKQSFSHFKQIHLSHKQPIRSTKLHNERLTDDIESTMGMHGQKTNELKNIKQNEERAKKCVDQARLKLQTSKNQYDEQFAGVSEAELTNEFQQVQSKQGELREKKRDMERQIHPLNHDKDATLRMMNHLKGKIESLKDIRQQRLNRLRRKREGERLIPVIQLIDQMKAHKAFQANVFGPVMIEIEVEDEYHSRILEHAVAGWLSTAFVFENTRDARLLIEECRKRFNGYTPDTMTTPTTRDDEIDHNRINNQHPPTVIDDQLRRLGISCVVSDIFKAPSSVKAALNAQASLHCVYVGSQDALVNQETLRRSYDLPAWYTPESRNQLTKSNFNPNARNLKVDSGFLNIRGDMYFDGTRDESSMKNEYLQKLEAEQAKLHDVEQQIAGHDARIKQVDSELIALNGELRQIAERRRQLREKADEVERLQHHLGEVEARAAQRDEQRMRDALVEAKARIESKIMGMMGDFHEDGLKMNSQLMKQDLAVIDRVCAEGEYNVEYSKHETARKVVSDREREVREKREERDQFKAEWKRKRDIALRAMSDDELEQHQTVLAKYIDRIEEAVQLIDVDIDNLSGQIEGIASAGSGIVEAYELRERKIKTVQREISDQLDWYKNQQGSVVQRKKDFVDWLNSGINRMRQRFSELYRRLGCSGDIRLVNNSTTGESDTTARDRDNQIVDDDDGGEDDEDIGSSVRESQIETTDNNDLKDLTLQVLVSYRNDMELRPVSAQANSGGEKMCCTMIFCFSLQVEQQRIPPFIMVDELNQGLDPSNEMKIMTMMIEDASKEVGPQSFVVTPKLLSNLPLGACTKTHIIFNGRVKGKRQEGDL